MIRLVRAEWTKLFTTRVWIGLLLGACVMVGGFAALLTAFAGNAESGLPAVGDPAFEQVALAQATNASVLFLILGIIGMTQEYRHRTATPTFLTTPRRWKVVVAKLVAYALVAVPFALVLLVGLLVPRGQADRRRLAGSPVAGRRTAWISVAVALLLVAAARIGPASELDNPVPPLVVGLGWPLLLVATGIDIDPAVLPAAAAIAVANAAVGILVHQALWLLVRGLTSGVRRNASSLER